MKGKRTGLFLTVVLTVAFGLAAANCKGSSSSSKVPGYLASDVVANADWTNAVTMTVQMVEGPGAALSYSPANLTLQAGEPVILTLQNSVSNLSKHYYTAPEFYKTVAWRKAQTSQAEYKAPYFKAFELLIGGSIDLYFVPITPGTYPVECTITGHAAAGMTGSVTVTGAAGRVNQEVSPTWNRALDTDPRTSGSNRVWTMAQTVQIETVENTFPNVLSFSTIPRYAANQGYIVKLKNPAGNQSKHYYTATAFNETCVLRKAQDADAEIKAPYLKAVELLFDPAQDKSLEMYIVPTVAGSYDAICTIGGHQAAGMEHTFTVDPAGTMAGDIVSAATWPGGPTDTVFLEEPAFPNTLSFNPSVLTWTVGTPVILRVTNPAGNQSKHYFSAPEFFKTAAWRKVQTSQGEYKAPYFKAVELLVDPVVDRNIDLYFVPMIAGTFTYDCTIGGHAAAGMTGTITVTGDTTASLDLAVSPTWDATLDNDPRTSGSDAVWNPASTMSVDIEDTPVYRFNPANPVLNIDTGYILTITCVSAAVSDGKHYYWSPDFFETCVTRKFQDADAEIKAPYFNGVELLDPVAGDKTLDMYIVPTALGTYLVECTITGHAASGMEGTITIQ